ncbi:MAG: hypothetical protein SO152_03635, partial [Ruminococcus sp.]|nr:hypothetical protein [Ruminococcus sp.]
KMNIIEVVKETLQQFPKISQVCNDIHIDFTDDIPTNYGLSPTGDTLIKEDILGNQTRQHTFILYAVFQSQSDYDRMANSGTLLELQHWLENKADNQKITVTVGDKELTGELKKITCANGMLYAIPDGNLNSGVLYQLQITAQYKTFI